MVNLRFFSRVLLYMSSLRKTIKEHLSECQYALCLRLALTYVAANLSSLNDRLIDPNSH